jgi:small subunit ribosomal protein S4
VARYTGPVCRLCRREKIKLFLKGAKCETAACPVERRPYPPGEHGRGRTKETEYMLQLREKQKARRIYGILEGQLRQYYEEATRAKGVTGERLLQLLELRLDNVVYRAGFAESRNQARQLVRHGHVQVNGRRVTIPSYRVKVGDEAAVRQKSARLIIVRHSIDTLTRAVPEWLSANHDSLSVRVMDLPARRHVDIPVAENLIVEFYSK